MIEKELLWTLTGRVDNALNSFKDNATWQNYDLSEAITPPTSNLGFSGFAKIQDVVFFGTRKYGVIGYNTETNEVKALFGEGIANMPSLGVYGLAVDRSNQLWIGTDRGLRVLYNPSNFFDSDASTNAIIFLRRWYS